MLYRSSLLLLCFSALGCHASPSNSLQDGSTPDGAAPAEDTLFTGSSLKVAAVQYGEGDYQRLSGCKDDLCGLKHLVELAAKGGARIVVTPEYALGLSSPEPIPKKGDRPVTSPKYPESRKVKQYSRLADELNITLIATLLVRDASLSFSNAMIAFDAAGEVVAVHRKFHLFGNETKTLKPGASVAQSTFDTPIGKAGILICADIQCVVAGVGPDCEQRELKLLQDFAAMRPRLVFFSAKWTVGPSSGASEAWWPLNVQKKYAVDGKAYVIAANTTAPPGQGGGIFKPGGAEIVSTLETEPGVIYAEIPK